MSEIHSLFPAEDAAAKPRLTVINGDGPDIWLRTPGELGITHPITPEMYMPSNVLRNIHPYPYRQAIKQGNRTVYEEKPRTPYANVIRDLYRYGLPPEQRDLANYLHEDALLKEHAYEQQKLEKDTGYQNELAAVIEEHSASFIMQSFRAYFAAAEDYDGLMNEIYLTRAKKFGAHLIRTVY